MKYTCCRLQVKGWMSLYFFDNMCNKCCTTFAKLNAKRCLNNAEKYTCIEDAIVGSKIKLCTGRF